MSFRELRDIASQTDMTAICMSSMAGNESIDIEKINSKISSLIDKSFAQRFPYAVESEEDREQAKQKQIDEMFKLLDELNKKTAKEKAEREAKEKAEKEAEKEAKEGDQGTTDVVKAPRDSVKR